MRVSAKKYIATVASTALLALGLYGCGGGGGDGDGPVTSTETTMPDAGMATEFGDDRFVTSPETSPEASSAALTLASFTDSDTPFGPIVSPAKVVVDDEGNEGVVLLGEDDGSAYVESVTVLDQQGRFAIVYVVNGQRTEVQFGQEDVFEEDLIYGHYKWYFKEIDNIKYNMWNHPTFSNLEPVYRQYFGLFGWQVGDSRGFASAGVLTPPDRLARLGSASYEGQVVADFWNNFLDPSLDYGRARLWGALTLEADFSDGSVEGEIDYIWVERPGTAYSNDYWEEWPDTTSIDISGGDIRENRFHAEWRGEDTNTSAGLSRSMRGFEGSLLGEFYGPNGEEAGGVLIGQRESTNQLINGVFGTEKQ